MDGKYLTNTSLSSTSTGARQCSIFGIRRPLVELHNLILINTYLYHVLVHLCRTPIFEKDTLDNLEC